MKSIAPPLAGINAVLSLAWPVGLVRWPGYLLEKTVPFGIIDPGIELVGC